MAWIESHQGLGNHPKTRKLARLLGISHAAAIGHLHYLWWGALDFAQDGNLEKYDIGDIAETMHWEGDAQELIDALVSAGFLDNTEKGLTIHDWNDYTGKLAERREKDRSRKRISYEKQSKEKVSEDSPRRLHGESAETPRRDFVPTNLPTIPTNLHTTPPYPPHGDSEEGECVLRFADFWEAYPRKVGKSECFKAWKKLNPSSELFEKIMTAVKAQSNSEQWNRESGRFIPNPLTWLNGKRWELTVREGEGGDNAGYASGFLEDF